jgi:hypothetical protein
MKKQDVQSLLDQFPDDVDADELMHRLYLKAKLEQAEAAVEAGDVLSHEDVVKRSREWFE